VVFLGNMLIIPLNSKFLLFIYTSLSFLHIDIVSLFYASEKNMKSSKCTLNIIPYKQNFGGEFNLANCYTIVQLVNIFFIIIAHQMQLIEESPNIQLTKFSAYTVELPC